MNNKFEICRNCPVDSALEEQSKIIINRTTRDGLSREQVKAQVSSMSAAASQNGCPSEEIIRLREQVYASTYPSLGKRVGFSFRPTPPEDGVPAYITEKGSKDRKRL